MNKVIMIGRLTKDPDVSEKVAKYTIAVDRSFKKEGQPDADFIPCVAFGNHIDFVKKFLKKGTKILVEGRWQTGSFEKEDGSKVYTNDLVVERHEFVESKRSQEGASSGSQAEPTDLNSMAESYPGVVHFEDQANDPDLPF